MITVRTYPIVEQAVYNALALSFSKLMPTADPETIKKVESQIDSFAKDMMDELSDVLDFGEQPIQLSNRIQRAIWEEAHKQTEEVQAPKQITGKA